MIGDVIEEILEFMFRLIFEIFLFYTGEYVLYVLTFGRKKPRWNYYAMEPPAKWVVFTSLSVWIGFAFSVLIIALITRLVGCSDG